MKTKGKKLVINMIRKPMPPPGHPQTTKKGKRGYSRRKKDWRKQHELD